MKRWIVCISLLVGVGILRAQSDINTLYRQADMYFKNSDWLQTLQTYDKLQPFAPTDTTLYIQAIIAAAQFGTATHQLYYTELAFENGIPVERLWDGIAQKSRLVGQSYLYEKYLLLIKKERPYYLSLINKRLIDFYRYRRDDARLADFITTLMADTLADISLMKLRAKALFNSGNTEDAVETYQMIEQYEPNDKEVLLFLGNHLYVQGMSELDRLAKNYKQLEFPARMDFLQYKQGQTDVLKNYLDDAAAYLQRTRDISSTPVIEKTLKKIESIRTRILSENYPR